MSPPALVALALNVSKVEPSRAVSNTQGMGERCQGLYWFCLASSSDLPSLPPGSQLVQPHANTTAGNEPFPPSASSSSPGATISTCPGRDSREQTCPHPPGRRGRADPPCTPGCAEGAHHTPSLGTHRQCRAWESSSGCSHLPTLPGFVDAQKGIPTRARWPCQPCPPTLSCPAWLGLTPWVKASI